MIRSIPSAFAGRALALLLGLQLAACVSPPVGGGPPADERLELILSNQEGATQEELARDLRFLTLDHPRHVPSLVADAAVSIETGRTDRAVALLDTVLSAEPDQVDAVLLWTRVAAGSGDLAGARRRVEAALRTRPDSPELHEADASLMYLEDRLGEAIQALDRADALRGGESWRSAYHRGLIDEARGELEAAEGHYSRSAELDSSFEPAARRLRWIAAERAGEGR
ncbi:MAG: tetratricopeptide repeat protein [Planctomycetota bacterium]|nr:tetratricopeptide repeat protein [Planctomycetota bacterium]MEC8511458.1 tetratricopeptide repeat protein [Planctomycetota bacterium]